MQLPRIRPSLLQQAERLSREALIQHDSVVAASPAGHDLTPQMRVQVYIRPMDYHPKNSPGIPPHR